MQVYLARHGVTNYNELKLCNADPTVDVHLTKTGIEQVKTLANKLKAVNFDVIYISELKRTKQSAEIINQSHNVPIVVDARLNDNRTGFEGRPVNEYYDSLRKEADNKWSVRFGDGESLEDTKQRVSNFIDELRTKNYKIVLIVTSMSVVQAFYGIINKLTNQQTWDFEVEKGSCIEIEVS